MKDVIVQGEERDKGVERYEVGGAQATQVHDSFDDADGVQGFSCSHNRARPRNLVICGLCAIGCGLALHHDDRGVAVDENVAIEPGGESISGSVAASF